MRPDLVLFDCDGVLVDTEHLQVEVESRVLTDLGWPMTPEEVVVRWMGRAAHDQLAEVAERLGRAGATAYDERSRVEIHEAFEHDLTEVEGISALLDVLEAHDVATCVASSGSHERMRRTLGLTGLLPRFEGRLFSALDVEHGKPEPDLFLHAARSMGVAPQWCVVVEDSPYGVRAGVSAGMRVLGFGGGLAGEEPLRAAGAEVFDHMADVPRMLGLAATDG